MYYILLKLTENLKKDNSLKELLHQRGKNAIRDNNENNSPTTSYYKFS